MDLHAKLFHMSAPDLGGDHPHLHMLNTAQPPLPMMHSSRLRLRVFPGSSHTYSALHALTKQSLHHVVNYVYS